MESLVDQSFVGRLFTKSRTVNWASGEEASRRCCEIRNRIRSSGEIAKSPGRSICASNRTRGVDAVTPGPGSQFRRGNFAANFSCLPRSQKAPRACQLEKLGAILPRGFNWAKCPCYGHVKSGVRNVKECSFYFELKDLIFSLWNCGEIFYIFANDTFWIEIFIIHYLLLIWVLVSKSSFLSFSLNLLSRKALWTFQLSVSV